MYVKMISFEIIISMLILIIDAIVLFLALTALLKIPGNKKILRKYSTIEKSSRKEMCIAIFILILFVIATNFIIFVIL